jgi:hypothetical protein
MPVTVNTDLPLHPERSTAWDGDAARSAMARRCANDDGVMADCMGQGFVWRDADANPATIGAYSLPVANVFDGQLHLVLSGVQAAANAVSPAREAGGPRAMSGSEAELGQMRSAIETILARFAREFDDPDIRAPWERESETSSAVPVTAASCCGGDCCGTTNSTEKEQPVASPVTSESQAAARPGVGSRVLRASATGGEWRPPTDHFANPHLGEPTKLTVTADGRVYGHLATWDQPHIGYDGKLVYPPKNASGAYEYFRQSAVVCSGGEVVPVGIITMNTGHADESLSADAASAHYDNTGTMVAAVNVGEDAIGIWLAGSMLPDVGPDLRTRFGLARVSGDWRQPAPGKGLELIAALSVPNPGFPVRQNAELLASDRYTLAASGRVLQADGGEVRTFICAGAAVVDEAQQEALNVAVQAALGVDFFDRVKNAVIEAVRPAREDATGGAEAKTESVPTIGGDEAAPAVEGEPATEGEQPPVQAPDTETAPAAAQAATDAPSAGDLPAPAGEPAAVPAEGAPAGAQASAALAASVRRMRAKSARERVLAAAGLGKKA